MASYFLRKDKKYRSIFAKNELKRLSYKFFLKQGFRDLNEKYFISLIFLKNLKKKLLFTVKSNNRCLFSSRSGSIFRFFRLSRIRLKNMASCGFLTGVRKAS